MAAVTGDAAQIPLWIKLGCAVFVAFLVPVYLKHYGPANFLWFSDVALLATSLGLWAESPLVLSTMTVAVALPEILWNLDFFARLLTGRAPLGMAAYMFDRRLPCYLRGLSLFHVALPILLLWSVGRLGYDPRALPVQTVSGTLLMILSYTLTDPSENINWVFGPGSKPQRRLPPRVYMTMVIVSFPVLVYWPTHLLLTRLLPIAR
ncbi:MAG: membrane-associated protein [Candidatus Rokuibacteriota bacterium]|nr:MAG: membrane-associated protein [Candidatus Rokubacteria bacterium]